MLRTCYAEAPGDNSPGTAHSPDPGHHGAPELQGVRGEHRLPRMPGTAGPHRPQHSPPDPPGPSQRPQRDPRAGSSSTDTARAPAAGPRGTDPLPQTGRAPGPGARPHVPAGAAPRPVPWPAPLPPPGALRRPPRPPLPHGRARPAPRAGGAGGGGGSRLREPPGRLTARPRLSPACGSPIIADGGFCFSLRNATNALTESRNRQGWKRPPISSVRRCTATVTPKPHQPASHPDAFCTPPRTTTPSPTWQPIPVPGRSNSEILLLVANLNLPCVALGPFPPVVSRQRAAPPHYSLLSVTCAER